MRIHVFPVIHARDTRPRGAVLTALIPNTILDETGRAPLGERPEHSKAARLVGGASAFLFTSQGAACFRRVASGNQRWRQGELTRMFRQGLVFRFDRRTRCCASCEDWG